MWLVHIRSWTIAISVEGFSGCFCFVLLCFPNGYPFDWLSKPLDSKAKLNSRTSAYSWASLHTLEPALCRGLPNKSGVPCLLSQIVLSDNLLFWVKKKMVFHVYLSPSVWSGASDSLGEFNRRDDLWKSAEQINFHAVSLDLTIPKVVSGFWWLLVFFCCCCFSTIINNPAMTIFVHLPWNTFSSILKGNNVGLEC